MYKEALRSAWVEINLTNADYNIKKIKEKVGEDTDIIGVIKADAYGHGAVKIAEVLRKNGVKTFAVATLREAVVLREAGAIEDIIVLSIVPGMYAEEIAKYNISPVISSLENAKAFSDVAVGQGSVIKAVLAIDTGMGRIGYLVDTDEKVEFAISEIKKINDLAGIEIAGLLSHFAVGKSENAEVAMLQQQRYVDFLTRLKQEGLSIPVATLANSAAIIENKEAYFDAVRPGIILYGCYPSKDSDRSLLDIKPVMSVKANIVYLKKVPVGYTCSYGCKFVATRPTLIATLSLGYADGLPRAYGEDAQVIVNGKKAPIIGRICMDQCMVDVTDIPGVKIYDEVIIMGSDGKNKIAADDIAAKVGTINYEILCEFGRRLPKVYVK